MREKCFILRSPLGYRELVIRYNIKMDMPQTPYFYGDIDLKIYHLNIM